MSLSGLVSEIGHVADRTPPERERAVDLVRATSIAVVVVGHWIVMAIVGSGRDVTGVNALGELTWMHPLTWAFQVMPLFFLVGGYSNAASLRSHRRDGGRDADWLIGRADRIVRPSAALLAVLAVAVVLARAAGAGVDTTARAAWAATVPLWFLLVYLVVVALAPVALALHDRFGAAVPAAIALVVVAADAVRLAADDERWAAANHVLMWLVAHQLGIMWRDDGASARRVGRGLAVVAPPVAIALVALGPYPASMVSVPGAAIDNTAPPTAALLAFALGLCGVVMAACRRLDRLAHRRRVWLGVVAVNSVILTVFVWHMTAAIVVGASLHASGLAEPPPLGSAAWLAWRVPWILASAIVLMALVAAFAVVERSVPNDAPPLGRDARRTVAAVVAVIVTAVSLVGVVLAGSSDDGPLGLPTWSVVGFVSGAGALAALRRPHAGASGDTDGDRLSGRLSGRRGRARSARRAAVPRPSRARRAR